MEVSGSGKQPIMSLRPSARTEVRRNRYKVTVDADEGRRRREDNMVEIRKSKREESLLKKRREGLQAQQFPSAASVQASNVEKKVSIEYSRIGLATDYICGVKNSGEISLFSTLISRCLLLTKKW